MQEQTPPTRWYGKGQGDNYKPDEKLIETENCWTHANTCYTFRHVKSSRFNELEERYVFLCTLTVWYFLIKKGEARSDVAQNRYWNNSTERSNQIKAPRAPGRFGRFNKMKKKKKIGDCNNLCRCSQYIRKSAMWPFLHATKENKFEMLQLCYVWCHREQNPCYLQFHSNPSTKHYIMEQIILDIDSNNS